MSPAPPPIQIRPYVKLDAAATLAIFVAAITQTAGADYTAEQIEAWVRSGQTDPASWHLAMSSRNSFVATVNGEVAGFSDVAPDGYIAMMFVSPDHQGIGIARRLLAEAEQLAREARTPGLSADVSITARPLFERCGFQVVRVQHPVRDGVPLTNFRMEKLLQ